MYISNWVRMIKAYILDIINYDVILGKDWLFNINPYVDWQSCQIMIYNY